MKLFLFSSVCVLVPAAAMGVEPVKPTPFVVGVCTHFSQGKGLLPVNLEMIRQAGITSIRDEVAWSRVEREKGRLAMPEEWDTYVRRAASAGLSPMLILDYGNQFYDNGDKPLSEDALEGFARYSEFVVRHFKGTVRDYEIWNEWDIKIGSTTPGTAESYTALLKKVYPRIKAIDPTITVYGGGMTPGAIRNGWLEKMLAGGALSSLDVVSIHTYNYGQPGREGSPEAWAEWMQQVQDLITRHNQGKPAPLYVTEMGWPTQVDRRGRPAAVSADYLARMFLLSRSMPFLKGIWWYDFQDDGWKATYNEDNFGIVRADLTPKPAWFAMAGVAGLVSQSEFLGRRDTGDPDVHVLAFRDKSGKQTWAIWSSHADDDWQVTLRNPAMHTKPLLVAPAGQRAFERPWGTRNWAEERGARGRQDAIDLAVRGTPWLVSGDLSSVAVESVKRRPFAERDRATAVLEGKP